MSDRLLETFNLRRLPFSVDIAVDGLFPFDSFKQGVLRLENAARQKTAMLVVGEPGTGKTAMIRSVVERLQPTGFVVLEQLVHCGKSPVRAVVEGLLGQLGEPLPFNNPPRALQQLKRALLDLSQKQRTPVVILDDVHHLSQTCWLTLKSLLNYELDSRAPLVLLLVGNPSALRPLNFSALEEVRDRLAACYHLKGLSASEVSHYLERRLIWAGADRPVFPEDVAKEIAAQAGGVPRRVNRLANACMIAAAYTDKKLVDRECLQIAMSELQFQVQQREEHVR